MVEICNVKQQLEYESAYKEYMHVRKTLNIQIIVSNKNEQACQV